MFTGILGKVLSNKHILPGFMAGTLISVLVKL